MRSTAKRTFYYRAHANALGGFVEEPFAKPLPCLSSVSLPQVGGVATQRTEAYNFEEIICCRAAYTRVSGRPMAEEGPWSITATAVVEGLKILEVLTAERLVAQVSIEYPQEGSVVSVSLAGCSFEGLRIGGCEATPVLNAKLLCGARAAITYPTFLQVGREQADHLIGTIEADKGRDQYKWLAERFGWMASNRKQEEDQCILASLVDGVSTPIPATVFGHTVEIPDFGRLFLGELLVSPTSFQVSAFRAELGCGLKGRFGGPTAQVQGVPIPP